MTKDIKKIVIDALMESFSGDIPVYGIESWNSGYVDDLTDEAIGVFRLQIDITDDIWDEHTTKQVADHIAKAVKVAPDFTRFNDHHFILFWMDEAACKMTVEYGEDEDSDSCN